MPRIPGMVTADKLVGGRVPEQLRAQPIPSEADFQDVVSLPVEFEDRTCNWCPAQAIRWVRYQGRKVPACAEHGG